MKKTLKHLLHDLNNPAIKLPYSGEKAEIVRHTSPILEKYGITNDADKREFHGTKFFIAPSGRSGNKTEFKLPEGISEDMAVEDFLKMIRRERLISNIEFSKSELETAKADVIRYSKEIEQMESELKQLS